MNIQQKCLLWYILYLAQIFMCDIAAQKVMIIWVGEDYDILQSPIGATLMKSKCYNDNCNGSQHKHSSLLT